MVVIRVPKTPASAMNPNRRISSLLRNQIEHLQEAEFRLPANRQSNIYINDLKTEGQAAEYIRIVTAELHPQAAPKRKRHKTKTFSIAAYAPKKPRSSSKAQLRSTKTPRRRIKTQTKKK